jgi:hypothetical protein
MQKTKKVHKSRSYRILTVLAGFQPGGAHHHGPQQAHEDPGAGDEHYYNKYSKNYGVGGHDIHSHVKRRGLNIFKIPDLSLPPCTSLICIRKIPLREH